jgi:hypothetical protein
MKQITSMNSQHSNRGMTMDEQCKYDLVPVGGMSVRSRRCENNAKLDGFCMTHHPDKVKLRKQKSEIHWQETHDNAQTVRLVTLRKAEARIVKLEMRLDAVEKIIDRLETLPQETLYSRGIAYELRSALQQEARE